VKNIPLATDLKKVLLIGSGPIVIGQAAEFDYSGSQACRAIREEGIHVVLVNSNPATIQTDSDMADSVYIEPLVPEVVEKIIAREKPQGIIATMAGQTGLNLAMKLKDVLARHGVRFLGTDLQAIELAEDRDKFRNKMIEIGQPVPTAARAHSLDEGRTAANSIGLPVMVRPDFCLGGTGSAVARNEKELQDALESGLRASTTGSVLIEKSLEGTAELEYEVIRDAADNCITICSMENFDAVGVHTGESIVVAPVQTLSDDDNQKLRSAAISIIRALGVQGACNVQFALDQNTGEYWVIEVNPRASRSSALASKATGYPIARVAAKIALGYTLPEIKNKVTGKTACFEPAIDYVVVKIPRWPFDKFRLEGNLGAGMKSTGEAMAIGRTFEQALHKAIRSLELRSQYYELAQAQQSLSPTELRLFQLKHLLEQGESVEKLAAEARINPWFLHKLKNIAQAEARLRQGLALDSQQGERLLFEAKRLGLPDARISTLCGRSTETLRALRKHANITPSFRMVDTCAGEFEAFTPYFYSTYGEQNESTPRENTPPTTRPAPASKTATPKKKVIILGAGPIRIGQGIEFDYCTVHAVSALRELGFEAIVINNNPETVSTDFDVSDRLYFEPLTGEDVYAVIEQEKANCIADGSELAGVLVQFGGQTALNLARPLKEAGITVLGTEVEALEAAQDRKKFLALAQTHKIPVVNSAIAFTREEALSLADYVEYPVLVRPSFVLGGRAMEVATDRASLERIVDEALRVCEGHPLILDHFLNDAIEIDVDLLSDGETTVIAAILEQVEEAGIHSGDSCCALPTRSLSPNALSKVREYSRMLSSALKIVGLANIQMMAKGDDVFVLELNPRASRTLPFVSKVTGVQVAKIAAGLQAGAFKLASLNLPEELRPTTPAVKSPVFSFHKFPTIDPKLGAEMKSTGETMGAGTCFEEAFIKSELGAGNEYGNTAIVCHCGRWRKTIESKLREAGVKVLQPATSEQSKRMIEQEKPSFIVCGIDSQDGAGERSLAAKLSIPCVSSAFKALAIAKSLTYLRSTHQTARMLEPFKLNTIDKVPSRQPGGAELN